jgi:hypothetical protein
MASLPLATPPAHPQGRFHGIWGRPYIDLSALIDLSPLPALHDEICYALSRVDLSCTGASLKWMDVVSPDVELDPYADAMHVISRFTREEFTRFVSLADDPDAFDADAQASYEFGDETDHPLSERQCRYLRYRYGVYFPWKVAYHLVENVRWEDKNSGRGKGFGSEASALFPETVEFVRRLPFREIGRAVIFGLEANDHAPVHRDTKPGPRRPAGDVDHCITICPRADKRFFLTDVDRNTKIFVTSKLYWFNDMDWHGVEPDPFFRYSIRVDGVFEPSFVRHLLALVHA